jgi:hypothetical protein
MAYDSHSNFGYSTVTVAPSPAASGTTLTVADGAAFPSADFNVTIWPADVQPLRTNAEIARCTSRTGNVLTIVRAQEGTSARTVVAGDQIANSITVKIVTDIEAAIITNALTAIRVSASTTSNLLSALTFSNANGVTFGLDASTLTASVNTNYAGTNGAITGGSITVNTSGVSVNLPAYLTTAMLSNATTLSNIRMSAGTTSNLLSAVTFGDANGLAFQMNAGTITGSYTVPVVGSDTEGISNLGNTAGTSGVVSGTGIRVVFAGGNNITLSQSINASSATITISGPNTSAQQTGISGIAASNTTYTSGSVTFTGVGGGVTVSSNTGQRIDISVAAPVAQTVQTQNLIAASLSGNTAGVLALVSSGTMILAGGNNITLSQNGQSITVSGANVGGAQTGISGVVVSDTTYTSGTISFSNVGNITISSSVNAGTQYVRLSVATPTPIGTAVKAVASIGSTGTITRYAPEDHQHAGVAAFAVTNTGTTAGNTRSQVGTLFFAASGNITASQSTAAAGNDTIWFSVPAQSAQTGISGVVVSDTTYTSGTVSFSNQANVTIGSSVNGATQYIRLSGNPAQTVQTQNLIAASLSGNTAGVLALVSSGTMIFAGGNNITLSQNGQSVTISGANAGGAQTGISGIVVSDTTYTSGTVSFSNAGNITISSSVNGATQYIRLSVAADAPIGTNVKAVASVGSTGTITRYAPEDHQHAGVAAFAVTNTGNTLGNTRSQVGTLFLAASGGITASQSTAAAGNDTVWLSVAAPVAQTVQTQSLIAAVYDGANSISTGTVRFTNANGVSFSVNGQTVSGSISAIKAFGASNTGNTAGNTGVSTGVDWILAGSNNITVSQSTAAGGPNTLWVSGPTVGGAQTGISGIVVSDTTYTSGTVSFSNQANITIGSSVNGATQYIRLSGNPAQTNQSAIEGFGISNTGQTAGNTGISTGIDWVLAGSGSITLSQSTAAGTNTVWIQHPAWITTATQSSMSVSDAATSGTLARLAFTNLNGVTLSLSTGAAGSHTIVGSHNAITSQSTQFLALTLGGNTAGTTTFHATNNASLFLNGGNNITLSGNGSTVTISAAAQTNQQMTLFATGNTTQSSTGTSNASSLIFAGSGIASVGITNGSVLISVPSGGGGLTNIRMSAGTTSNLLSDVTFADSNGISFGINASTITASANTVGTATTVKAVASANSVGTVTRWAAEDHAHAGIGGIGISTSGNEAGTTGSNVGTYWFEGGNNVTLSQITSNNGSHTIVVSGPPAISQFDPDRNQAITNSSLGQSTLYFRPVDVDGVVSASRINFFLSVAFTYSGAPANSTAWLAMGYGLYTRGTGASTDRISLLTSYSMSYLSGSVSSSTRLSLTHYIGLSNATSHSTSGYGQNNATAGTYLTSSIGGYRAIAMPMNLTLQPGRYWLGFSNQSASQGASWIMQASVMQYQYSNQLAFRQFVQVSAASNASFYDASNGFGIYSAQSAGWPNSIPLTSDSIRAALIGTAPYFNISGIGTSTGIL